MSRQRAHPHMQPKRCQNSVYPITHWRQRRPQSQWRGGCQRIEYRCEIYQSRRAGAVHDDWRGSWGVRTINWCRWKKPRRRSRRLSVSIHFHLIHAHLHQTRPLHVLHGAPPAFGPSGVPWGVGGAKTFQLIHFSSVGHKRGREDHGRIVTPTRVVDEDAADGSLSPSSVLSRVEGLGTHGPTSSLKRTASPKCLYYFILLRTVASCSKKSIALRYFTHRSRSRTRTKLGQQ